MNEESEKTALQSRRGRSNIDLSIVKNRLLKNFNDWEISEDETFSDHIIKFEIGHETNYAPQHNHNGTRCIVKEQNYDKFDKT